MRRDALARWVPGLLAVIALGAILAGALAVESRAPDAQDPAGTTSLRFGVNGQGLLRLDEPERTEQARLIARAGLRAVRFDIVWHASQPSEGGPIRFERTDAVVLALARAGLQARPILDYSAEWASTVPGEQRALPRRPSTFVTFATAVSERYGPGGSFWEAHPEVTARPITRYEIWNEPNLLGFSRGGIDPARFARLVRATSDALRSVQPGAEIVMGGLADAKAERGLRMSATRFLRRAVAAEPALIDAVDAVGLHSYATDPDAVVAAVQRLAKALDAIGMGAAGIELNEWGIEEGAPGALKGVVRDAYFAAVPRAVDRAVGCRLTFVAPHTWVRSSDPAGGGPTQFALVGRDQRITPRVRAYQAAARGLSGECGG